MTFEEVRNSAKASALKIHQARINGKTEDDFRSGLNDAEIAIVDLSIAFDTAYNADVDALKSRISELEKEQSEYIKIINSEIPNCGDCAKFGKDCTSGDVDGNEDCRACEKFISKRMAELEEACKQMMTRWCNFKCSCKNCEFRNEPCARWRKILESSGK